MGFFTKESHTHFNRDENGKVVSVEGDEPVGDRLIRQSKVSNPSRWQKFKTNIRERAQDAAVNRKKYRDVYREAYQESRLKRAMQSGRAAGFGLSSPVYVKPGKPRYVKTNVNSTGNMFGYPMPDYDTYHSHKKKHPGGKKQYVIVSGKAYEKAVGGSKKTKKKKVSNTRLSVNDEIKNMMKQLNKPW